MRALGLEERFHTGSADGPRGTLAVSVDARAEWYRYELEDPGSETERRDPR